MNLLYFLILNLLYFDHFSCWFDVQNRLDIKKSIFLMQISYKIYWELSETLTCFLIIQIHILYSLLKLPVLKSFSGRRVISVLRLLWEVILAYCSRALLISTEPFFFFCVMRIRAPQRASITSWPIKLSGFLLLSVAFSKRSYKKL